MDNDQFGGRTDDDLFADDFEPIAPENQIPIVTPAVSETPPIEPSGSQVETNPSAPEAPASAAPPSQTPKSLAQSRHNRPEKAPRSNSNHSSNNSGQKPKLPKPSPAESTTSPAAVPAPPPTAPKGPAASTTASPASANKFQSLNTASAVSEARLGSGANPRTKMTEDELAAKMDKMRIINAEKQRRFQQTQADENAHAEALARSQEEMAKRRAEDAAKRRAAEEDRKRLEDERAKNRERKLNAMGKKEGGWDEGKEERQAEEDRRGFRSAYGGVRGSREGGGGLSGSRFADQDAASDGYGYNSRGRGGRGRGGRGRGRGGHLFDSGGDREYDSQDRALANESWAARRDKEKQTKQTLKQEDFPALPFTNKTTAQAPAKKIDTTTTAAAVLAAEIPLSPPVGKWDEEVAAMEGAATTAS